jgi:hypothetical protein
MDGVSLAIGSSAGADFAQVAYQLGWPGTLWRGQRQQLDAHVEFGAAYWRAGQYGDSRRDLGDFSVTPVLRLSRPIAANVALYGEAGIGLHFLTHTVSNPDVELSTRFEFGDLIGFGMVFGGHGQFDVAVRYLHLSNGGIRDPNHGADLIVGRLAYRF